jgi:plastocyanin
MRFAAGLATVAAVLGLAACGGGGGGGSATCTPGQTASMTIKSTGLSPTNVCVLPTGSVTFTNSDTVPHHLEFNDTTSCPTIPEIAAGTSPQVTFPTAATCTFHDASNAPAFSGTVAVTAGTVSGGGY